MNDCPRLNKWFRGCKFEARCDYIGKFHNVFQSMKGIYEPVSDVLNAMKTEDKIYVCDVCIRCGKRVERNQS